MVYILLRIWDIVYAVTTSVASIHQGCASPFWMDTILVVLIIQVCPSAYMGFSSTGFCRLAEGAPPETAAVRITHAYIIKFKCGLIQ